MKKTITIFAISTLLTAYSFSQVTEITVDTICESTTWSDTVHIIKDLTIDYTTTLIIEPGTVIEFQGHYKINVKGNIVARGTPSDSIFFTVNDTLGFHDVTVGDGGWNGIKIDNSDYFMWEADTTFFQFCRFEYSKSILEDAVFPGGAITMRQFGLVILNNCLFTNNSSRTRGGAIFMEGDIEPGIFHCSFINNSAFEGGAIHVTYKVRPLIYNCLFYKNTSFNGGAVLCDNTRSSIINCTFSNNSATNFGGAIHLTNSRDRIIGNLIVNNYAKVAGGAFKIDVSWPEFHNNTVCYNHAGWAGGLDFWGLCNADFYNNIIWGNTFWDTFIPSQIVVASSTATPNFYNCIIEGGTDSIDNYLGHSAHIITDGPQFIKPSLESGLAADGLDADFAVESSSPAINMGYNNILDKLHIEIDLRGTPRIAHGIIDIGAYEKLLGSFDVSDTIKENTTWIADTVKVESDIVIMDSVTLNIAPGTYVEFQGHYRLEVIGTIKAIGSGTFPITFSVKDTTGFANDTTDDGSWGGIVFDNSQFGANAIMNDNDTSRLHYCTIQYAKNMSTDWDAPHGGAVCIRYFSNIEISNCTIQYNMAFMGGGIQIDMFSHPYIHNNLIYRNFAMNEGGGLLISNNSGPRIINNYIFNNTAKRKTELSFGGGIRIVYANPILVNNVICNNYASNGGGLYLDDAEPLFYNNTVCNNLATLEGGGMVLYKSIPDIFNSVFWGNVNPVTEGKFVPIASMEDVNFYHNNIEGGRESITPWWFTDYKGEYIGNIDADPVFKNPTQGAGPGYDALAADWSLTDYSSNINKGFPESQQILGIPDKDIAGKRRYNQQMIDIGAFENQGEPVHIIREPNNHFACVGDTVEFSVEVEGKALFQWLKDGEEILDADTNVLILDSVSLDDKADYICVLYNGYGLLISNNVTLEVNAPPEILLQTESQWVKEDASLKLEIHGRGTEPVFYSWMKNGEWIPEADRPEYRISAMAYEDEGIYYCSAGNVCGETVSEAITLFVAPQICMVTVDVESGKNLIVWEKKGIAPIASFNVFRESIVAGEYEPIGNVSSGELSIFIDTDADPTLQAYIYKITALDGEGFESDIVLCKPHKTIHLLTTTNLTTGATQLAWDHYYGFTYGTFYIYRSLTESNFTNIHSMASSTTAYTDPNPENELYYYRVAVQRPEDCLATGDGKKAGAGPYSHALSNTEDNRLQTTGIEDMPDIKGLEIIPNPLSDYSTIRFNNPENKPYLLRIFDLSGKIVKSAEVNSPEFRLYRDKLERGYFTIELRGEKLFRSKLIIE